MAIGEHIVDVQKLWMKISICGFSRRRPRNGTASSRGRHVQNRSLQGRVMLSPGHTLASITYIVGDAAFIHDTIFQPDWGTARTDFPAAARRRFMIRSWRSSPCPTTHGFSPGHDYRPNGRPAQWESTVGAQSAHVTKIIRPRGLCDNAPGRDKTCPCPS